MFEPVTKLVLLESDYPIGRRLLPFLKRDELSSNFCKAGAGGRDHRQRGAAPPGTAIASGAARLMAVAASGR